MLRALKISGFLLFGLILLLLAVVFFLLRTPIGQNLLDAVTRPTIEQLVERQLDSEISYDTIRGALPGKALLTNVRLTQNDHVWLEVEELSLDWSPWALFSRHIDISTLSSSVITLYQRPTLPSRSSDKDDSERQFRLPKISIDELQVDTISIKEPFMGTAYELSLEASAVSEGSTFEIMAAADTRTNSDSLRADLSFDGTLLLLDASLLSAPDGLLTSLLDAQDTVWVSLNGEGPLERWNGSIDLQAGFFGRLSGQLGGNLGQLAQSDFSLNIEPGPLLPAQSRTIAGDLLYVTGSILRDNTFLTLTIEDLSGRFGRFAGLVRLPTNTGDEIYANLSGDLSEELANAFSLSQLAGLLAIDATINRLDRDYAYSGSLNTTLASLTVTEGITTEDLFFDGRIAIDASEIPISQSRFAPFLKKGGLIRTDLTVTRNRQIDANGIDILLGQDTESLTLTGDAMFDLPTRTLQSQLKGNILPGAADILIGRDFFNDAMQISVDANGPLSDIDAILELTFPQGETETQYFSSGMVTASISGLPSAPTGEVELRADDRSYGGEIQLRSRNNSLDIPSVSFASSDLTISGSGQYARSSGQAKADLTITAPERTKLITGAEFAGTIIVDLSYGGEDHNTQLDFRADQLLYNTIQVAKAEILAQGPLDALVFTTSLRDADIPQLYLAATEANGRLEFGPSGRRLRLDGLSLAIDADQDERRVRLESPTSLSFNDGISLAPTRLNWFQRGQLDLQGRFSGDQWKAEASFTDIRIPQLAAPISGNILLDTQRPIPGTLNLSTQFSDDENKRRYDFSTTGQWNGQMFTVNALLEEDGHSPYLTADIDWPLTLTRQNGQVRVAMPDREIAGILRAQGEISPLYALLPTVPPYLTGKMDADLSLTGTSRNPGAEGQVSLSTGRFEDGEIGITLTEIEGDARFTYGVDGLIADLALTGADAEGGDDRVSLTGQFSRTETTSTFDSQLLLTDALVVNSPSLKIRTGADLTLSGSIDELTLAGTVNIGEINADISENTDGNTTQTKSYPELTVIRVDENDVEVPQEVTITEENRLPLALDLDIIANNEIFVSGRGLESEWAANLSVSGTSESPILEGDVRNRRGSFTFAGRDFAFDRGLIIFPRASADNAKIEARASYDASEVTAFVNVGGTLGNPTLSLSSSPTRPEEDVMALILFGKSPTELSAIESLQIANALRGLAGIGPTLGGNAGLQGALGLDALSFGIDDATGEGVVAVGKYISDDIYVSARQSARGTSSEVTVTYEMTKDITVESKLEPTGAQDVSINYKRDY